MQSSQITASLPEEADKEEEQILLVEMKTRQTVKAISAAKEAVKNHGDLLFCKYGDDVFNDCVPASNRKQLLHQ